MKWSAIIFDLDGTLIDSEKAYVTSLKEVGIDPTGCEYLNARNLVKLRLGINHVCSRNRLLYFKLFQELNHKYSPRFVLEMIHAYEESLAKNISIQWLELKRNELLDRICKIYPTLVLTNENTRTQMIKLKAVDPDARYFKYVITSEEVGIEKPAKEMFLQALQTLRQPAINTLMVGDSIQADLLPAHHLGLSTVLTTEFNHSIVHRQDIYPEAIVIQKLTDLVGILEL